MKCKIITPMLTEYLEGTISAGDRKLVEEHIASCKQCARDAQLIAEAFQALRNVADDSVPANYFTNLVPRIHERLENRRRFAIASLIPAWLEEVLAPVSALAVVASLVALFFVFEPTTVNVSSALESIVSEIQNSDTTALSDFMTSQNITQTNLDAEQHVLETVPDPTLVTQQFEKQLLPNNVEDVSVPTSFISSDPSYESLSSDEVDQVIERLSHQTIL
jgi:anti-sigma-K factor RskA